MKKQFVVKKNYQFQLIISKGKLLKTNSYFIYYLPNNIDHSRFGVSVGVKLGNAVLRNKVKRQVRSMINSILLVIYNNKNNKKNYDYVLIVRKNYFDKKYSQNFNILLHSLNNKKEY